MAFAIGRQVFDAIKEGYYGERFDDLYFVKTKGTPSGMIEVHILGSDTAYKAFSCQTATCFLQSDANDGTFVAGNSELVLIKKRNTGTNTVELHFARREDDFKKCYLQTSTAFSCAEAQDGHFRLCDGYLYFIKIRNCQSGKVEVFRAKGSDGALYQSAFRRGPFVTDFDCVDDPNGIYDVPPVTAYKPAFDLCFLKTANTGTRKVEYHESEVGNDYCRRAFDYETLFGLETNGNYYLGRRRAVVFVKLRNSGSGKIEVMVFAKGQVRYFETCLGPEEADNGLFLMGAPSM